MTKVPEAITARLQEIEDRLAEARQKQNDTATAMARLAHDAAQLAGDIAARRRDMRDLKLQRKTLRYAVDAIEGRVIYAGAVEAPTTEPFVERVVVQLSEPAPQKKAVYETLKRMDLPATAAEIAHQTGIHPTAVGAVLGKLRKEGRAARSEEGMWVVASEPRPERRQLKEDTVSPKETVYETIRRLGPATPAKITEETGLLPRAVAGVLGTLKKQGKAIRTEEGLWGPAHQ